MRKIITSDVLLGLLMTTIGLAFWLLSTQIEVVETKQQQTIDSLQTELFNAQNNVGRYEITLELLSQEDESAAAKFDSIYNNETE